MLFLGDDTPNPMRRMMAAALTEGLTVGKHERPSKEDAALVAKVILFPATAPIKMVGGELLTNGAESLLAHWLQKIPKGLVEFAMLVAIELSPVYVFLLWKYGVFESGWASFLALVAKFV
jgi:hypothetical protein